MDQIGWDGQPRPRQLRREASISDWPKALEARSDTYMGEPFLGRGDERSDELIVTSEQ